MLCAMVLPRMRRSRRRWIGMVPAVLLTIALVSGACSADGSGSSTSTPATDRPAGQLTWTSCGSLECAEVEVPLDHAQPGGPTIAVAISRNRADSGHRRGVLLVNPGGPGASGLGLASTLARAHPALDRHFDIIGFDPRGVERTSELTCDEPLQAFYRLDNDPDEASERHSLIAAAATAADACAQQRDLLAHIGTSDVVDDLDAIRAALGETSISYLGLSYGSVIGLTYATRYPERVRAIVVDGVTDPAHSLEQWLTSQAVASEAALDRILTCSGCEPGGPDALASAFASAETGALGPGAGPSDVARAAILATYSSPGVGLPEWLDRAEVGDGSLLARESSRYLALAGFDAYTAVKCLDTVGPSDADAYLDMIERVRAVAPVLGPAVAAELFPCATWPVASRPLPAIAYDRPTPLLILANVGDAATPFVDAQNVSARLESARLITLDGTGHLSLGRGSECVDDAVVAYLVDLLLPAPDLICG